jgi:hypothetical protein
MIGMSAFTSRRAALRSLASLASAVVVSPYFCTNALAEAAPLRHGRGVRLPLGLRDRVKAQNVTAQAIKAEMYTDVPLMKALTTAYPLLASTPASLPAKFDWRPNKVSQVKDQFSCGSCWAFAAIGAYESGYLIANNKNAPLEPGVSEQEALDCTFVESDCVVGGWHEVVLLYLRENGEVDDNRYRYTGAKGFCTSNLGQRPFYLANWGYVRDDGMPDDVMIPSDAAIKQAIYQSGPVVTAVLSTGWDAYYKRDEYGSPNPNWSTQFPDSTFRGIPSSTLSPDNVDHEVVIVGWDDGLGVWIVKNSWGTNWGDEGFMLLSYGSNNIGFATSWLTVAPTGSLSVELSTKLRSIQNNSAIRRFYPQL